MTQKGKCDICRARKVKCDEVHPFCGPCRKGRRRCAYSTRLKKQSWLPRFANAGSDDSMDSSTITRHSSATADDMREADRSFILALRKVRKAQQGAGVFRNFSLEASVDSREDQKQNDADTIVREPALAVQLSSFILRWRATCELIVPGEPQPNIMGEWLDTIPKRLGRSHVLDTALDCLISSVLASVTRKDEDFVKTFALNGKALVGIRGILLSGDLLAIQDIALPAISFLYGAEVLAGDSKYKVHMSGRNELIISASNNGQNCTETCKQSFFTHAHSTFMPSIMQGRDSAFDTPTWLALGAPPIHEPEYPDSQKIEEYITRAFVRIPRLVRLLRHVKQVPDDLRASEELLELASDLYQNDLEEWLCKVQAMGTLHTVPTTMLEYRDFFTESFSFQTTRLFSRLLKYWLIRCVVSSCVLAMLYCGSMAAEAGASIVFEASEVIQHEEDVASCILMSVQWGSSSKSPLPLFEASLAGPLMHAFGVLSRTEKRAVEQSQIRRARALKTIVLDTVNTLASKFKVPEVTGTGLEARELIFQGESFPLRPRSSS